MDIYAKTQGTAYGISFESVCQEVMGPVQPAPPRAESPGGASDCDRAPCAETGVAALGADAGSGKGKKAFRAGAVMENPLSAR